MFGEAAGVRGIQAGYRGWPVPAIPALQEAEAEGALEPRGLKPA